MFQTGWPEISLPTQFSTMSKSFFEPHKFAKAGFNSPLWWIKTDDPWKSFSKAANLLNEELDNIDDKNNALVIAGLTLANKFLTSGSENKNNNSDIDFIKLIKKIDQALEK